MLADRKALVENEIRTQIKICAELYKRLAFSDTAESGITMMEYVKERDKLATLEYDLKIINSMLEKNS